MSGAEIIAREEAYRGFYRLERVKLRHARFDGGITPVLTREIVARSDIVAVLPYDRGSDELVMIEQFRPGALLAGAPPCLLEIVAGYIEPGEAPADAARRETLEETGCAAGGLEPLATYLLAPNFCPDRVHLYLAIVRADHAARLCGRADEDEDIRVRRMPRAEAVGLALNGGIASPWALTAILLVQARQELLGG